jgi:hypothetical protein
MGEWGGVPIDINDDKEEADVEERDGAPRGEVDGGETKESDDESDVRWDGKSPINARGLCPTGDDDPQRETGGDTDDGLCAE